MQPAITLKNKLFEWAGLNSVANRIKWAYSVILSFVILGLAMQWQDLSRLAWQLEINTATAEIVDSIRDVRRFEKNWFLYGNLSDLETLGESVDHIFSLLHLHSENYKEVSSAKLRRELKNELERYRDLIHRIHMGTSTQSESLQGEIRKSGHNLVQLIRTFQEEEQASIQRKVQEMNRNSQISGILVFIVTFYLGRKLIHSVVRPLGEIVNYTRQISVENYEEGWEESSILEIKTLTSALNTMVRRIKEREGQILQNTKMATLGTLIAGIAHELNNPLSNISTSAEILHEETLREGSPDPELLSRMTGRIIEQTDRAKRIVRSLLEFSREKEILPEKIMIKDLLFEVAHLIQGKLAPRIDFQVRVEENVAFYADRQRIQQVLINLILNAIHAVEGEGTIVLSGKPNQEDDSISLEVEDSGCGIPPDVIGKIFDPFFTTKDVGEGFGLGLAVSREMIQKHGGEILVDSKVGEGTRITLKLPGDVN